MDINTSATQREIRSTIELLEKSGAFSALKDFEVRLVKFQLNLIAKQAINDYRNAASAIEYEMKSQLETD